MLASNIIQAKISALMVLIITACKIIYPLEHLKNLNPTVFEAAHDLAALHYTIFFEFHLILKWFCLIFFITLVNLCMVVKPLC